MRIFFFILSIAYIAVIFLFAGSPIVSALARFNPHSLLHIPLYGILTFLLIFSFIPMTQLPVNKLKHINQTDRRNEKNQRNSFILSGLIASIVGIADEIHQAYVPGRDSSATDVLLDLVGIILVLFIFSWLLKTKRFAH
jgi:hypothetical protein